MMWKRIAFGLLIIGVLLAAMLTYGHWWHCSSEGLAEDAALKIVAKKLDTQSKRYATREFSLESANLQNGDWMFTYVAKDCTLDIVITKCGVADVGGMTRQCLAP